MGNDDVQEEEELRGVALKNAESILIARRRAEEALLAANEALEKKTRELQEQREWFEVSLSSIGDAVITTDVQGCITFLNPVAERMTDDEGRAIVVLLDDRGDIGRKIFKLHALPRAGAFADAARLRPQHAEACARQPIRDGIEIGRAAAERRQHHDARALALHQNFQPGVAMRHHETLDSERDSCGCCNRGHEKPSKSGRRGCGHWRRYG